MNNVLKRQNNEFINNGISLHHFNAAAPRAKLLESECISFYLFKNVNIISRVCFVNVLLNISFIYTKDKPVNGLIITKLVHPSERCLGYNWPEKL